MMIEPPVSQRVEASGSHRRMFLASALAFLIVFIYLLSKRISAVDPKLFWMLSGDILRLAFSALGIMGLLIIMWIRYPVYLGFDERNLYLRRRSGLQVFALDELDWFTCESVSERPRYLRPTVRLAFSHRGTDHELSRMIPLEAACALARKFVPPEKMLSNERARKLVWSDLGYYLRGSIRRPELVFLYVILVTVAAGYVLRSVLR